MTVFINLLTSVIIAIWMGAIAVLSVQNFTPVSLKFLAFQSFEMPVGLILAFSVGLGLVGTALLEPLLGLAHDQQDLDQE
jgi:uncharacterized integral membrane protein